jgi:UDP-N-acetylglucosamine 4,6-dehydratase
MLSNKRILVTGGTGSFGKRFVETLLQKYPNIPRLVIYSRDELKQYEMAQAFPKEKYPGIRFFIGDVRDYQRLKRACEGIDVIIHAAALKHVPIAEYNPFECISTNVLGAQNVINAALDTQVQNVVALSTDKAAAPLNLYGATKLCSDKLFISANNIKGSRDLKFSVVRYGNVFGSRGSVVPFFLKERHKGIIPITNEAMTRFNITLDEGINIVHYALEKAWGGEIFVPKIPSYRILDVAQAVAPDCKISYVGVRPGEKIHEEMITENDSYFTYDSGDFYIITPTVPTWDCKKWKTAFNAEKVKEGFCYNSGKNDQWLTIDELRNLIRKHLDPSFSI